jgi:hypothetical protein
LPGRPRRNATGSCPERDGELVGEALDDEVVMGDTHYAPKAGVEHRLFVAHVLDLDRHMLVEHPMNPAGFDRHPKRQASNGEVVMRATRAESFTEYRGLELIEAPTPRRPDGRVLVQITAAGVSPLGHTILFGG